MDRHSDDDSDDVVECLRLPDAQKISEQRIDHADEPTSAYQ